MQGPHIPCRPLVSAQRVPCQSRAVWSPRYPLQMGCVLPAGHVSRAAGSLAGSGPPPPPPAASQPGRAAEASAQFKSFPSPPLGMTRWPCPVLKYRSTAEIQTSDHCSTVSQQPQPWEPRWGGRGWGTVAGPGARRGACLSLELG